MWNLERKLKTRAALRAAAAVVVSLGGGCHAGIAGVDGEIISVRTNDAVGADGTARGQDTSSTLGSAPDAGSSAEQEDTAIAHVDAGSEDAASSADIQTAQADTQVAVADEPRCSMKDGWERYAACCKEMNWDFKAGCMAWGPPAPPAMPVFA